VRRGENAVRVIKEEDVRAEEEPSSVMEKVRVRKGAV
jgi:hypothetical protein